MIEVCDKDTGYEGGGRRRETWWRQTAARKELSATLYDISAAARERCWESSSRGEGGGGRDVVESYAGSNGPKYAVADTGENQVGKWSC